MSAIVLAEKGRPEPNRNEEPQSKRIFRSPEERREADLGTQVTDWLKISSLIELETSYIDYQYNNNAPPPQVHDSAYIAEVALDITFSDLIVAEIEIETEHDNHTHSRISEALIGADLDNWGLELGRLDIPFGEYYSHFVSDPILAFGETQADAFVVDYSLPNDFEIAAYTFKSNAYRSSDDHKMDWGVTLEYSTEEENFKIGLAYLSDLAESDEEFLQDYYNRYSEKVSAWNAHLLWVFYPCEVTMEYLEATQAFVELDQDSNQPLAYNFEFAYYAIQSMQIAVRYERSRELNHQPEYQYGIAATWAPGDNLIISVEFLHGKYQRDFIEDDYGNTLLEHDLVAARISLEF